MMGSIDASHISQYDIYEDVIFAEKGECLDCGATGHYEDFNQDGQCVNCREPID